MMIDGEFACLINLTLFDTWMYIVNYNVDGKKNQNVIFKKIVNRLMFYDMLCYFFSLDCIRKTSKETVFLY